LQNKTLSLAQAQKIFASLPAQFSEECTEITITRNNQPILTILPYKTHQEILQNVASLQTMLEIRLGDEAVHTSGQKITQKESSRPATWEDFQKEVGW
jgi:hypothetical protein